MVHERLQLTKAAARGAIPSANIVWEKAMFAQDTLEKNWTGFDELQSVQLVAIFYDQSSQALLSGQFLVNRFYLYENSDHYSFSGSKEKLCPGFKNLLLILKRAHNEKSLLVYGFDTR